MPWLRMRTRRFLQFVPCPRGVETAPAFEVLFVLFEPSRLNTECQQQERATHPLAMRGMSPPTPRRARQELENLGGLCRLADAQCLNDTKFRPFIRRMGWVGRVWARMRPELKAAWGRAAPLGTYRSAKAGSQPHLELAPPRPDVGVCDDHFQSFKI